MNDVKHNYLPGQYDQTNAPVINHNYLPQQFADSQEILADIAELVRQGDFTLGRHVDAFEDRIKELTGSAYAVGTNSGTDAIGLSLKAAGIEAGNEIITTPYTFHATVGAIVATGGRPVFADIRDDYNIDPARIADAVTEKTKAIVPVHWAGLPCDMEAILEIASQHELVVVEDACHAIRAEHQGKAAGTFGIAGCFSLHPLKNLNVWGDGGYMVTDDRDLHERLVLLRNHGLVNRDECLIYGHNSRLDSLQAIVANHLLKRIDHISDSRIANAARYDERLGDIPRVHVPDRSQNVKQVYHLYIVRVEQRDELQAFLIGAGIDAKVHYPIPMHLQPAARDFGYTRGDFPVAEATCDSVLSLPVHEFVTEDNIDFVAEKIREFYA